MNPNTLSSDFPGLTLPRVEGITPPVGADKAQNAQQHAQTAQSQHVTTRMFNNEEQPRHIVTAGSNSNNQQVPRGNHIDTQQTFQAVNAQNATTHHAAPYQQVHTGQGQTMKTHGSINHQNPHQAGTTGNYDKGRFPQGNIGPGPVTELGLEFIMAASELQNSRQFVQGNARNAMNSVASQQMPQGLPMAMDQVQVFNQMQEMQKNLNQMMQAMQQQGSHVQSMKETHPVQQQQQRLPGTVSLLWEYCHQGPL